jgi:hypothetical protein
MFGIKKLKKRVSEDIFDLMHRVDNQHDYTNAFIKRLQDAEKIVKELTETASTLYKKITTLEDLTKKADVAIWKLENPPKYKVGDKPFANLMVIRVIFIEKKFLELDKPAYFWEYEAYNSKTKKTGKYDI